MSSFSAIVVILVLIPMVIHSSSTNELKQQCKIHKKCAACCLKTVHECRVRNTNCAAPPFAQSDVCFLHKNNPNYMVYFKKFGCDKICKLPNNSGRVREIGNDAPYFFEIAFIRECADK